MMQYVEPPPRLKCAFIYANKLLICIDTASGYRSYSEDYKGKHYTELPDIPDKELGNYLASALACSRYVVSAKRTDVYQPPDVEFDQELFDYVKSQERYKAWVDRLMAFIGSKTRGKLFKPMYSLWAEQIDGIITLRPSNQERLQGWDGAGIKAEDSVQIADTSTPEEIGAAVRLGLSRCTSIYDK